MKSNRIEAFTDGVIAIIITIMVLEMSPPQSTEQILLFISQIGIYAISFIYVGIYWMNHHHLFQTVRNVNGKILITNLGLLFFLSLIPLATSWLSEEFYVGSLVFYGFVLFMCSIMYFLLITVITKNDNHLTTEVYDNHGKAKEYISVVMYFVGIIFAFIIPLISLLLYFIVAMIWIVPDYRIEQNITTKCNK